MGKGVSPLVSVCKERKEFIKATKNCTYDFVIAFVMYLESLLALGNALNQYVEQELVIFDDGCVHVSLSNFDPSEEHSQMECPSSNSDSGSLFNHLHCEEKELKGYHDTPGVQDKWNTCKHHEHSQKMSYGQKWETPQGGHCYPQQVNQNFFGGPMSFSYFNDRFAHHGAEEFPMEVSPSYGADSQKHGTEQNNPINVLPTPSPPHVSTWDFLYPFSMNYDVPYDHDHHVKEIREREGIPDLEDESEQGPIVSVFNQKGIERGMKHGSGGTSNVTQLKASEDALSSKYKKLAVLGKTTEDSITQEDVWHEAEETTVHSCESLTTPVSSGRMSFKEAVLDIKNGFKFLYDCGKEFLSVIEMDRLPYHSVSTKLRVQRCLCPSYMLRQPAPRSKLLSNADIRNNQEQVGRTFDDISSTLEKLYLWEKKLYKEIMGEEKLRIPYDKHYRKLKKLDDRGCESDKINDTLASVKLLHSEINVAVASIGAISREINELRDTKLLPELNKLIEGLIRLWKVMSTCHRKQFQTIRKAKYHVHILDPGNKKKSSSKATQRLERVNLNWSKCFCDFINTQKALVGHLNKWLLRYIRQESEETEDGIGPVLPSAIGVPPIFRVCDNWYHAINKISENGVTTAIDNFASSLHQLHEKLEEEKILNDRVVSLSKDYQYKLKSFCQKKGISSQHYFSFINIKATEDFVQAEIPLLTESDDKLAISRKRLVEQRKKHQQVIKHVNDIASSCFQEGMTPIFEALESFCLKNLKIYEQLSPPNFGLHE